MGLGRGIRRIAMTVMAAMAALPVVALVVGTFVDRGPSGEVRVTAFYLALNALDPAVWEATWNSLLLAVATTLVAWTLGIGLARLGSRPFRGRAWLQTPSWAMLAVTPLFAALGWKGLLERLGIGPESFGGWAGWLAALAAEATWAVPLVALAAHRGLTAIDPTWEDAVRLAGGGRWRAWWRVFRPIIRPHAARALAVVFTMTLAEPGAPIILGLRRTLAYELVQDAIRPDTPNWSAALALLVVVLSAIVRAGLVRVSRGDPALRPVSRQPPRLARRRRIVAAWLGIGAWLVFAMAPLVGLVGLVTDAARVGESLRSPLGFSRHYRQVLDAPDIPRLLGHSAALGATVASIGLLAAWSLGGQGGGVGCRVIGVVSRMPPLALAIGGLMVPGLLVASFGDMGLVGGLARRLDPVRSPGALLVLIILTFHLPACLATIETLRERSRPRLFEAARTLGASRLGAWRALAPAMVGPGLLVAWLRLAVIAALDLAAVLVLTPSSTLRTLGPGVLDLISDPGGLRRAALLALIGTTAGLVSLALAAGRGLAALVVEPLR